MKKKLFILGAVFALFFVIPSSVLYADSYTVEDNNDGPERSIRFLREGGELTMLELEDLLSGGTIPKTPGVSAIEMYMGDGSVYCIFNKAKSYTMKVRNEGGQVVHVTSIVPEMETYTLPVGSYTSGRYSITFTNTSGVDIYRAVFVL